MQPILDVRSASPRRRSSDAGEAESVRARRLNALGDDLGDQFVGRYVTSVGLLRHTLAQLVGEVDSKAHVSKFTLARARSGEGAVDRVGLALAGLVVGVDLGGLDVVVAHPLLDLAHRLAGGGHPRAERVAQLVEGDLVNL